MLFYCHKGRELIDILNLLKVCSEIHNKIAKLEKEQQEEIEKVNQKYNKQIKDYRNALRVNMDLNEACVACNGEGSWVERDSGDFIIGTHTCEQCNGTGLEPKQKK